MCDTEAKMPTIRKTMKTFKKKIFLKINKLKKHYTPDMSVFIPAYYPNILDVPKAKPLFNVLLHIIHFDLK